MSIDYRLDRKSLPEAVAEKLETMILSDRGRLTQRLPSEQAMAASFGVSRSVVREALVLLRARGLVSQKSGACSYISSPTPENLAQAIRRMVTLSDITPQDLFEVRVALETAAVRLAAENADAAGLARLERLAEAMAEAETAGDRERRTEYDIEFHGAIAAMSGNLLLKLFFDSVAAPLREMLKRALEANEFEDGGGYYHRQVVEALRAGEPERAEEEIRLHLARSMRNYEGAAL